MESRSRLVTTNDGSIFRVAKLDWQFIGNIRLRGVTPSLRVSGDQQKSPLFLCPCIRLYLVESLSHLVVYTLHANSLHSPCVACVETSSEMGIEWLESSVECDFEEERDCTYYNFSDT